MGMARGFRELVPGYTFHDQMVGACQRNPVPRRDIERFYVGSGSQHDADLLILIHQGDHAAFFRWDFDVFPGQPRLGYTNRRNIEQQTKMCRNAKSPRMCDTLTIA